MSGDFAIAFLRVFPHADDADKMAAILEQMNTQEITTLSEFRDGKKKPTTEVVFPAFGKDQQVFQNNFLEVMQFVLNHTTFDPKERMDRALLRALKPLGVEPGKTFNADEVADIDGDTFAAIAEEVRTNSMALWNSPDGNPFLEDVFRPKGDMKINPMVAQSAVGPIGLPFEQAQYPGIGTADGGPMNAQNHYVIRMETAADLPPARAFWSVTLYNEAGYFFPNPEDKYSVGENGGMKLNSEGGLEIHVSPTKPVGVPEENWLPTDGKDQLMDTIMRVYAPNIDEMENWPKPVAELVP